MWQRVLFFQFHDILPGSSIKRVYDECNADYGRMLSDIADRLERGRTAIGRRLDTQHCAEPWLVSSSLSWSRSEWLKLGHRWNLVTAPPMSFSAVDAQAACSDIPALKATSRVLENDCLRVRFHKSGAISSIHDKGARREVLAKGALANRLTVYQDKGDAWDFPMNYAEQDARTMHLAACEATIDGPRASVRQRYTLGHSVVEQEIILVAGSRLLEFSTRATWRETESMLRTPFPVDILSDRATYEIQFGSLERPTHRNTSWDLARDEVPAQQWVDLSQRDYGVALVNDSKYGHKVKGKVLDLNLLRSVPHSGAPAFDDSNLKPGEPNDRFTDQEDHVFRYGLYPHRGDHVTGEVVRVAREFNIPLHAMPIGASRGDCPSLSMIQVDSRDIVVEAVKLAEDRESMMVRLYESSGSTVDATVSLGKPVSRVREAGLMEDVRRDLKVRKQRVKLSFSAFQIRTLDVEFVRT